MDRRRRSGSFPMVGYGLMGSRAGMVGRSPVRPALGVFHGAGGLQTMFSGSRRLAVVAPFLPAGFPLPLGRLMPILPLHLLIALYLPLILSHVSAALSCAHRAGATHAIPVHHR